MNRSATGSSFPDLGLGPADGLPIVRERDLQNVLASDLCVGCGACVAADKSLRLTLNSEKQMYEPSGPGNTDAAAVCPSVQVDYAFLQRKLFGQGAEITPLGVVDAVYLAQSADYDRNLKASSGGVIKELLHQFLSRGDVDGVIALTHVHGLVFEPRLLSEPEQIDRLPGSIYHNVAFDKVFSLLSEREGRFVVVATPCQLEGIYNYIFRCRPELADRISATIGLVCGWTYTHHAIRAICRYRGINFDEIEGVSYRGGGPVGRLRIRTRDREYTVSRRVNFSYQVAFDRTFNLPRCHLCVNHSNFLADIVVGDAWLPSTVWSRTGVSLVLCRNDLGGGVLRELADQQRLRCAEVSAEEFVESQTGRVAFGDYSYAYADFLRHSGQFCPHLPGPNRAKAQLWSREAVAKSYRSRRLKIRLQRRRRYRSLWWRKLLVELRPLVYRYVRWFFVRVVRVKSLFGKRKEVPNSKLKGFR
jgi:coenzyme F420-reducing hydrogenase beta subunit